MELGKHVAQEIPGIGSRSNRRTSEPGSFLGDASSLSHFLETANRNRDPEETCQVGRKGLIEAIVFGQRNILGRAPFPP